MVKTCAHCKVPKDEGEFSKRENGRLSSWCRECNNEAIREKNNRCSRNEREGMKIKDYIDKFTVGKFVCF